MKYDVSQNGVKSLQDLAKNLKSLDSEVKDCASTLQSSISGLGDGLGQFKDPILDLVRETNKTQDTASDSINELSAKLNKKASQIESLLKLE